MQTIDIFITAFQRPQFTGETLRYLKERTRYPYRLFLIDNGGNEQFKNDVDYYIGMSKNMGIHAVWNIALSLAESDYFITTDNDIYVPDWNEIMVGELHEQRDWLGWMVKFISQRADYGAISLHPHILIGDVSFNPYDVEDVKEVPWCGAVMRIMRTGIVVAAGGWERKINPQRNHEERTICGRLQNMGYRVGRTTKLRAYHPFGLNWGYDEYITPEMQGHNPDLKDYVKQFDNMDAYDNKTWLPKI